MFTTLVMRNAIAHEGRLYRPDYLNVQCCRAGRRPGGGPVPHPLTPGAEDPGELLRHGNLQLGVGARARFAIAPPAAKRGGVTKPVTLEMVVADLAHQLRRHGLPREVLLRVPPARRSWPAGAASVGRHRLPGMTLEIPQAAGSEVVHEALAQGDREAGRHPDMVKRSVLVVQAEKQRADTPTVLMPPETTHDAVCRAFVLHLQHDALALPIAEPHGLGDDAVEPGAFEAREPVPGHGGIGCGRSHVYRRPGAAEHLFEQRPSRSEGLAAQVVVTQGQQIEGDERGRRRGRQELDSRCGRVDPLQQGVEVETRLAGDHDLAVEDATLRHIRQQRLDELGEVARERLRVATAELHLRTVTEDQAAKAVPLGLVEQAATLRHLSAELCQHGGHGRHDRQLHRRILPVRSHCDGGEPKTSRGPPSTREAGRSATSSRSNRKVRRLVRPARSRTRAIRAGRAHGRQCRC